MEDHGFLDYLMAAGTILTPIFVLVAGVIVWKYRQSIERKIKLEEQLRDDRIEIYNQILEPFIILLMNDAAWASDPKNRNKDKNKIATTKMLSLEYRKTSFRLSLIGSDAVVSAYNDLRAACKTLIGFGAAQEHPNWQRRPRTAIGAILMATMVGSALAQPPIRYFRRTSGGFGRTVFREVRPP